MNETTIAKKKTPVQVAAEKSESAASVIIMDYCGLTAEEVTNLRKQLRDADVEMKVIRNSILSRAAKKVGLDDLNRVFTSPTTIAFSNDDVVASTEIIDEFVKDAKASEIKGSVTGGRVFSVERVTTSAKPPNCEGLLSVLLSVLQAPVHSTTYAVKAVVEKNEEVA